MKLVKYLSQVDESKCTGCKRCENICPAAAIKVIEKKAVVDAGRCVACKKCWDICQADAAVMVRQEPPRLAGISAELISQHQEQIGGVLASLFLKNESPVCSCTMTQAQELAAAVIAGARTPEDLTAMTGVGSGCGIYCQGQILKMLKAFGIELIPPQSKRWYDLILGPEKVPPEVEVKYPECRCLEDKEAIMKSLIENG